MLSGARRMHRLPAHLHARTTWCGRDAAALQEYMRLCCSIRFASANRRCGCSLNSQSRAIAGNVCLPRHGAAAACCMPFIVPGVAHSDWTLRSSSILLSVGVEILASNAVQCRCAAWWQKKISDRQIQHLVSEQLLPQLLPHASGKPEDCCTTVCKVVRNAPGVIVISRDFVHLISAASFRATSGCNRTGKSSLLQRLHLSCGGRQRQDRKLYCLRFRHLRCDVDDERRPD